MQHGCVWHLVVTSTHRSLDYVIKLMYVNDVYVSILDKLRVIFILIDFEISPLTGFMFHFHCWRERDTRMDPIKASGTKSFSKMWTYSYFRRALCIINSRCSFSCFSPIFSFVANWYVFIMVADVWAAVEMLAWICATSNIFCLAFHVSLIGQREGYPIK